MSTDEAAALRAEVEAVPVTGRGRMCPPELKERLGRYVRAARSRGETYASLSATLGVSEVSLTRWSKPDQPKRMKRVVVREPTMAGLMVTTRNGHRVSGLDVASLAELLRLLG